LPRANRKSKRTADFNKFWSPFTRAKLVAKSCDGHDAPEGLWDIPVFLSGPVIMRVINFKKYWVRNVANMLMASASPKYRIPCSGTVAVQPM